MITKGTDRNLCHTLSSYSEYEAIIISLCLIGVGLKSAARRRKGIKDHKLSEAEKEKEEEADRGSIVRGLPKMQVRFVFDDMKYPSAYFPKVKIIFLF